MDKFAGQSLSPFGTALHIDAWEGLGPDDLNALRTMFHESGLLVIRGPRFSHEEQIAFCRLFGPVCDSPYENFMISNVEEKAYLGKRELLWHNDIPYVPAPYLGASLHAVQVDGDVVGTRFASGFAAYDRLPAALKSRLEGLKALQVRERVWDRPNRLTDMQAGDICTVHDVIRVDPDTGRKYIFVNEDMTAQIIGVSERDSELLLEDIFGHFYQRDEIYEHKWAEGDTVLWNNLAIQHSRGEAGQGTRTLQRVTISELGYADLYPTDAGKGNLGNKKMLASATG